MKTSKFITNALIQSLNPCRNRLNNYVKNYGLKSKHIKAQFMGLKNITHQDKVWVGFRLIPKENIALVAADIAESVLHIFEAKYPNDLRPRQAIEAARSGDKIKAKDAADVARVAAAAYDTARAASAAASAADASKNKQEKLIRKIILKYWK